MTDKVSAIFSKLGIPIKTTVAASVLEEALNGEVTVHHLQIGQSLCRKVEKQSAHFYSVTITEKEAQAGIVCRLHSSEKSKFKLLYFDREDNGGLNLALQEDSENTGKVTCAGMCFFRSMAEVKDQDAAFSKERDAFQPCQIAELKAGTHYFAVYGDNFFMSANYVIEVLCAESFPKEKEDVRTVEAQILLKRVKLSKFKTKYEEAVAQYTEVKERHKHEMVVLSSTNPHYFASKPSENYGVLQIKELLKQRDKVLASYTIAPQIQCSSSSRSKNWQHHSRKMKND